ncbi:hypothetical protein ACFL3S_12735 [Gemmatimonadota bacterium]
MGPSTEEPDSLSDAVAVTGRISTPAGDRVGGVHIQLWGVKEVDPSFPTYDGLAEDVSDIAGEFSVYYPSRNDYSRYFIDLEIACFPIGLREVGCGAQHFEFVWNPPGS